MTVELEPFLTNKEVGAILRIHPAVVDRMARRGEIPALKVGKFWRYRKSELAAWKGSGVESRREPCRVGASF